MHRQPAKAACTYRTMPALYSYVLRYDDGTAPNPFWDVCTLVICKPAIRRGAAIGDWVVGTGSRQVRLPDGKSYDFSDSIVYAMQVTEKMTMAAYDAYCKQYLSAKIPQPHSADWRLRLGDCVYAFNESEVPDVRKSFHGKDYVPRDLSGIYALLSTRFYYFGAAARFIPAELRMIIKKNQGHLRIENIDLLARFDGWIQQFETNTLYGNPQLQFK